jgi:hypothetical protein
MSTTDQLSQWWTDHTELAKLFSYLVDHDLLDLDADSIRSFLDSPWDWTPERGWMLAGGPPLSDAEAGLEEYDRGVAAEIADERPR